MSYSLKICSFFFAILIIMTIFNKKVYSACDKCMRPQVLSFDCRVVPPRPSDTADPSLSQKIIAWRDLFWAAAGIKGYIFNDDPTKDCFTHLDGSFFTKGDTISKGITFGDEWANLPPSSGAAGGDYLFTGSVDGTDGNYSVTAELQVSKTREVVASAAIPFTSSINSMEAGRQAGAALGPILDKIRIFEKKKRDSGDPYALYPTAELHPEKRVVNKGEAVEVEVWLYDCDGDISTSPLKNRPVQLTATGGTLSLSTVTTGADGKAVVTFTAGDTPTEALIEAIYPFRYASEYESAVGDVGNTTIKITQIPTTLWKVSGTIKKNYYYDETQTSSIANINSYSHQNSYNADNFRVNAVIRNTADDSLTVFKSDTAPISMHITGLHTENELDNSFENLTVAWIKSNSNKIVTCTPRESEETAKEVFFSFFYSPFTNKTESRRSFSLGGWDMKGPAIKRGQTCNSEEGCEDDSYDGEAQGPIEAYIGNIESDSLVSSDSSYIDELSGANWTTSSKKFIRKADDAFLLHSYIYQKVITPASSGSIKITSTSTHETIYDFIISQIYKDPDPVRKPYTDKSVNSNLNAKINLRKNTVQVCYTVSENGLLSVRLFNLQGQLICKGDNRTIRGSRTYNITHDNLFHNNLICAEIKFTSASGNVYSQTQTIRQINQ